MILLALALQATTPPIVDWQPFPMQRTPAGGLFDRSSATRTADVVRAWVRLLNVEVKGVNEARQQADTLMEVDCRKELMRGLSYRVTRADGTVLKLESATPEQSKWKRATIGMRGYDARAALCRLVK